MQRGSVIMPCYKPKSRVEKKNVSVLEFIYNCPKERETPVTGHKRSWYYREADPVNIKSPLLTLGSLLAGAGGQFQQTFFDCLWISTDENLMMSTAVFLSEAWWELGFGKITLVRSDCGIPLKGPWRPAWSGFWWNWKGKEDYVKHDEVEFHGNLLGIEGLKFVMKVRFKYGYQENGGIINTTFEPKRMWKGNVSWT